MLFKVSNNNTFCIRSMTWIYLCLFMFMVWWWHLSINSLPNNVSFKSFDPAAPHLTLAHLLQIQWIAQIPSIVHYNCHWTDGTGGTLQAIRSSSMIAQTRHIINFQSKQLNFPNNVTNTHTDMVKRTLIPNRFNHGQMRTQTRTA